MRQIVSIQLNHGSNISQFWLISRCHAQNLTNWDDKDFEIKAKKIQIFISLMQEDTQGVCFTHAAKFVADFHFLKCKCSLFITQKSQSFFPHHFWWIGQHPSLFHSPLGHTAMQTQRMLEVGASHLVALCVSLPCYFPKCWMLSMEIACTIFVQVFGKTHPGIEPRTNTYQASILPLGHGRGNKCSLLVSMNY